MPAPTRRLRSLWPWLLLVPIVAGWAVYVASHPMDFRVYYYGARGILDGTRPVYGETSGMGWPMIYRYPPLFILLVAPFTLLPLAAAAAVWVVIKWTALLALLPRIWTRITQASPMSTAGLATLCLAAPYIVEDFRYGNAQFFVVALTTGALLARRRFPGAAAAALGLAVVFKVWPLFFVPLLAARRQFRFVAQTGAFTLAFLLLPSLWFGPVGNLRLLGEWYAQERAIQTGVGEIWFPSQSLRGVMMRYGTQIDYSRQPDPNYRQIHLIALDPAVVRNLWFVIAGVTYLGLLAVAFRSDEPWERVGWGLAFVALALLEPFTQKYMLVMLLWPLLAAGDALTKSATRRWIKLVVGAAGTLILLQPLLPGSDAQRLAQVLGLDFLATLLLGAAMLGLLRHPVTTRSELPGPPD